MYVCMYVCMYVRMYVYIHVHLECVYEYVGTKYIQMLMNVQSRTSVVMDVIIQLVVFSAAVQKDYFLVQINEIVKV